MDERNIGGAEKLRDIPSVDTALLHHLPNAGAVKHRGADITDSVLLVFGRP